MLSVRARMINGVLRALRLHRVDDAFRDAAGDPAAEAELVAQGRKGLRPEPPKRLVKKRPHERFAVGSTPMHMIGHGDTPGDRVLLYLHGGGYMTGPMWPHWAVGLDLSRELGCDFALPVYPKAPEHTAVGVIAEINDVYDRMVDRYRAENIVVAGDSAGGGLTLTLLASVRDRGGSQPRAGILISPWLDLTWAARAPEAVAPLDRMLTIEGARRVGEWYAGDMDPADPLISPLNADPAGLAPLHMWVGTHEIFLPDCRTFAGKARANGHPVTIREMPKGQHVAALFPTPEGRCARAQMVALIDWP
jgi:monoterpene epsilon-lactone hydrolase